MIDNLFKFPILMIDGGKEEEKEKRSELLAIEDESEIELIQGFAECPYYDFLAVTDRWVPTDDSYEKAKDGVFEACSVHFAQCGTFVVPWTRDKFKKELSKFMKTVDKKDGHSNSKLRIIGITKEELQEKLREDGQD